MIYYTCQRCRALLETDDTLAGQREACPNCGHNNDVPAGRTREQAKRALAVRAPSGPAPTTETVTHGIKPAAGSSFGWSPAQKIGFALFILLGLPLLRTMCNSHGNSPGKPARSSVNMSKAAVAMLPKDDVYSQPAGTGGNYRDPMNRYFEAQPPSGWQIVEKRDKGTFAFGPDSAQPGRVAPRSWIVFRNDGAEIGVIARESFSTIEQDFELVVKGYRERFGATVERSRFITIDGAKGGEIVGSVKGMRVLLVKYKKNGLDHAITMICPAGEVSKFFPEFERFVKSYRSLEASSPRESAARR